MWAAKFPRESSSSSAAAPFHSSTSPPSRDLTVDENPPCGVDDDDDARHHTNHHGKRRRPSTGAAAAASHDDDARYYNNHRRKRRRLSSGTAAAASPPPLIDLMVDARAIISISPLASSPTPPAAATQGILGTEDDELWRLASRVHPVTPAASLFAAARRPVAAQAPPRQLPPRAEWRRNRVQARAQALKDKKKKAKSPPPAMPSSRPPMRAGPDPLEQRLSFSTHLVDRLMSTITAPQRTALLVATLPVTQTAVHRWRVNYEGPNKHSGKASSTTIWQMILDCAAALGCCGCRKDQGFPEKISFLGKELWEILHKNLVAHFNRPAFEARLKAIQPLQEGGEDNNEAEEGIDCPICCDRYDVMDVAFCEGDGLHVICRKCLHRYAIETTQAGGVSGIPCIDPKCPTVFSTDTIRENLSEWDCLRLEEREDARNARVALAAKAVLSCKCGAVGVVENECGVDGGRVCCPGDGCGLEFCVECGNEWHEGTNCPPPKETAQWIKKETKPCPNCHTPIEKNGGCDHMHCAPPGGCGHNFYYSTLEKYPQPAGPQRMARFQPDLEEQLHQLGQQLLNATDHFEPVPQYTDAEQAQFELELLQASAQPLPPDDDDDL